MFVNTKCLNIFIKKTIDYSNLLLPPCHLKPEQLDGGNSIIRILAILCVILIHLNTYLKQWIRDVFPIYCFCCCCFWAVPAFICLSGKLIPIQIQYKQFYQKALKKIFLPTIFWSIVFSVITFFKTDYSIQAIVNSYVNSSPFFHLWFMFMLCGLYVLAPLCSLLIRKISFWHLLPFMLLVMLKPNIWDSPPWRYPLLISLPFIFLFFTGSFISKLKITNKIGIASCFSALCYIIFMGIIIPNYLSKTVQYPFFHYLGFFGCWGGASITIAILWIGTFLPYKLKEPLFRISQLVYGVYFIHPIVITVLIKLVNFKSLSCTSFFFVYVVVCFLCFFTTICCKKIPFIQRFL